MWRAANSANFSLPYTDCTKGTDHEIQSTPTKILTLAWRRGMLILNLRKYLEILEALPGFKLQARKEGLQRIRGA